MDNSDLINDLRNIAADLYSRGPRDASFDVESAADLIVTLETELEATAERIAALEASPPPAALTTWAALSAERGWAMPYPRGGAPWTEQEYADLREAWGTLSVDAIAQKHGRSPATITTNAQTLGLIPKPARTPLEPRVKVLCDTGLPELCARVIDLAAQDMPKSEIAAHLSLPKGLGSVAAYFQKAGLVWGIGGDGAHALIIEHARTLLRNV